MAIVNRTLEDALVVMLAASHVNAHKPWLFEFVETVNVVMWDTRWGQKYIKCKV